MKIPQQFPQFESRNTLLVTMGNHHGIIYFTRDGEIEQLGEVRVEPPEFSDNEGSFRQGNSQNTSFGSVLEPLKKEYERRFSKEFFESVKKYFTEKEVEQVYLFQPSDMEYTYISDWSDDIKKLTLVRFEGNFVSDGPLKLVQLIGLKRERDNVVEPEGEAKKILEKFN